MDEQKVPVPHRFGSKNVLLSITLILVIVGLVYVALQVLHAPRKGGAEVEAKQLGAGDTQVTQSEPGMVPEGFPEVIPVEVGNVTDSYKIAYKDYGITQYTVNYTSSNSSATIWKAYSDIMLAQGYAVDKAVSSAEQGFIAGKRTDKDLNVSINPSKSTVYVTVNYIERK